MDIQEVPNFDSNVLPKASYYKNQLNSLIEQMPSVLDDFQQYYVFTNTTPSSLEYQNMYQNILNNISSINTQVFTITNEIEKNTQTINSELKKLNTQIKEDKKENKLLKKKLIVPSYEISRIQEYHIFFGHQLCQYLEDNS